METGPRISCQDAIPADSLWNLILEIITTLESITSNVACKIFNQGSNQRLAIETLTINVTDYYFMYDKRKIFIVYGTPHLLKSIRNASEK